MSKSTSLPVGVIGHGMWTLNIASIPKFVEFLVRSHNGELFTVPLLAQCRLFAGRPSWRKHVDCFRILTVSTPPGLACYSSLIVDERPGLDAGYHVAALALLIMLLV